IGSGTSFAWLRACFNIPFPCRRRGDEALISSAKRPFISREASLLTSAPTISKHALNRVRLSRGVSLLRCGLRGLLYSGRVREVTRILAAIEQGNIQAADELAVGCSTRFNLPAEPCQL